jgi:Uma2 family endonuclease
MVPALESPNLIDRSQSGIDRSVPTQRMVFPGGWAQFQALRLGFEQSKRVRLAYYDGTIEIIMPGRVHELFKRLIGLLIEVYLLDRRHRFTPTSAMTQESEGIAAVEADESYEIGTFRLSIEVTITSGDDSKLAAYQALGVDEVWFWEDGVLRLYHLTDGEFSRVDRSHIPQLSGIDIAVFAKCVLMGETDLIAAMDEFRSVHPLGKS